MRYSAGSPGEQVANYFVDLMKRTCGVALAASAGEVEGEQAISFELQAREGSQGEEGVFAGCVPQANRRFLARDLAASSMAQSRCGSSQPMPACRRSSIEDEPRFGWRGLMLDSARHYQSPEFIEHLIDWMALHKLNVFHWHLTDDQGWRIEIKKYPKLTEVGAWRGSMVPPLTRRSGSGKFSGRRTAGSTRRTTCARSSRYAADAGSRSCRRSRCPARARRDRGVPGAWEHRHQTRGPDDWGVYLQRLRRGRQRAKFLENVLEEVHRALPVEVHPRRWRRVPEGSMEGVAAVQARMSELGLKDEDELQSWFITHFDKWLAGVAGASSAGTRSSRAASLLERP